MKHEMRPTHGSYCNNV